MMNTEITVSGLGAPIVRALLAVKAVRIIAKVEMDVDEVFEVTRKLAYALIQGHAPAEPAEKPREGISKGRP